MQTPDDPHKPLRDDVRLLGQLLGQTLEEQAGAELLETVESLRRLAKSARGGREQDFASLSSRLEKMPVDQAVSTARAFAHFLSLANIAEQHHRIRRRRAYRADPEAAPQRASFDEAFAGMLESGVSADALVDAVASLDIELVLTAHPTEVMRRTLMQKYRRIAELLAARDRPDRTLPEQEEQLEALCREIHAVWETDELRHAKPTPVDEATWGFVVIEQTIWQVLPRFLRDLDRALHKATGKRLPLDAAPVRFASWMGGDRDGNPNVTPDTTRRVCLLARWMSADLLHREVKELRSELSMRECSEELRRQVGRVREPYRVYLREVVKRLEATRDRIEAQLDGREPGNAAWYESVEPLAEALHLCHRSLLETDEDRIAEGRLTDVIRQVACFGLSFLRLDLRQESARHTAVLDAVTRELGLGSYAEWDEARRIEFLAGELRSRRPLFPRDMNWDDEARDVIETLQVAAEQPTGSLGAYVISLASHASDVLAVELLQKEAGIVPSLRTVPLFEKVADLRACGETLDRLFSVEAYRDRADGRQEVMVGYSDASKDGGRLAAAWALYSAQETIVEVSRRHGIEVTLFHGRGGTVGRGGGPIDLAVQAQPPGSIQGRLRVTEQGEMIQAKFGLPGIALRTLELYATSTLRSSLNPAVEIPDAWRTRMQQLADTSRASYREWVDDAEFIEYFRTATPVDDLGALNIGSRPARRKSGGGGLESLRAIPWIFAWTQMRLMVPAWLGIGAAFEQAIEDGGREELQAMYAGWPFFRSTLDLVEMVLAKGAPGIAARYDDRLVPEKLRPIGERLRGLHARTAELLCQVTGHAELLDGNPVLRRSIDVRNPYVDPINLVQVELLRRLRQAEGEDPRLREALMLTINGVAAGMRNTG